METSSKSSMNKKIVMLVIAVIMVIAAYVIISQSIAENGVFKLLVSIYSTSSINSNLLTFDYAQYQWLSFLAAGGLIFAAFLFLIEFVDIVVLVSHRDTNVPMASILVDKRKNLLFFMLIVSAVFIVISSLTFIVYEFYPSLLSLTITSEIISMIGYVLLGIVVIKWSTDIWRFI